MKSLITSLSFLMLLAVSGFAQKSDAKSKEILGAVSKKSKTYKTVSANFTSSLINKADDVNMTQKGTIKLSGEKYNIKLGGQQVICNGKIIWTYLEDDNEVMIDNAGDGEEDSELSPSKLFTVWETGFNSRYAKEATINKVVYHVIKLYPVNPNDKPYHTIDVYVNKKTNVVYKLSVIGKEGDIYTYTISNLKTNIDIPSSTFTFNKGQHPGIEETDMR